MKKNFLMKAICFILTIYSLTCSFGLSARAEQGWTEADSRDFQECAPVLADGVQVGSRFLELFFGKEEKREEKKEERSLIVGGDVFGIKMRQKYVSVVDAKGIPALKNGDLILSIDGKTVGSAADVRQAVEKSQGKSLTIRALHHGNEIAIEIRPSLEKGEYKLGLTLRDTAAGLGTITFIDPKTGTFGGLGHGICDPDSGEVIPMENGDVCGVVLGGIHKGESGKPGELCGVLTEKDLGDLTTNCECGVFGRLSQIPSSGTRTVEIGSRADVTEGEATIISTLKNGKTAEYKIQIYSIDPTSEGSKSFRVRVTDETLKALTGGIVRGMSGSPIIQNGKLVGAITHVLVADPTEGYGIFIENMLNAASVEGYSKAA